MSEYARYQKYLYSILSKDIKSVLLFNEWIMWSSRCNCERVGVQYDFGDSYYYQYKSLRFWCVDIICEKDLSYNDMPIVNWENQNHVFKECRKNLDLKAFASIGTHEFTITTINGKISPVKKVAQNG